MEEDQEKAIARERTDKTIAVFLVGPVGLFVGFCAIPAFLGYPPITFEDKLLCLTIGAVTAFAAVNGYYKVMQGRYIFGGNND